METKNQTAKHTPRPFKVGPDLTIGRFGGPTIKGPAGETLAVVMSGSGKATANARLIAAAPDLLAALEDIMAARDANDSRGVYGAVEDARAAIARAKGE